MIIDIIVIAVLLISALISFIRGFVRETLTILGVVGGLFAAYIGGPLLSPTIKGWLGVQEGAEPARLLGLLPYPILADILSYGMIFLAVVIVLSIISHVIAETVRALGLGAIDRTLGVIFGVVRGLLLMSVLYLPFHLSLDAKTKTEWFEGSKTQPWLEAIAEGLTEYLPDATLKQIETSARQVGEDVGVKDRLKQIDLLKTDEDKTPAGPEAPETSTTPAPDDTTAVPDKNSEGYSDDFRKKMDQMFQTGTPPAPQTPPPTAPPSQPSEQPLQSPAGQLAEPPQ